jgi:hypothetical protein
VPAAVVIVVAPSTALVWMPWDTVPVTKPCVVTAIVPLPVVEAWIPVVPVTRIQWLAS